MSLRTPPRSTLRAAALLVALAAGCAHAPPAEPVMWPGPPNKPRLKYVRSIIGSAGFDERFSVKLKGIVAGVGDEDIVFNPNGVAVSADDTKLYVTSVLGYVLGFDLVTTAVGRVADDDRHRPAKPYGLAVDGQGSLYVTDQMGEVFVYSAENRFLRTFGRGVLERPSGIAIDRKRQLVYVVDGGLKKSENHKIEVFAQDGRHLRTIGKRGTEPGQFLFPTYAAVSPDGDLFVADTMNSRVQVFDPDGNLVGLFGSLGEGFGQFAKPKGIAFDGVGNVHVVDGQLANVQVFNRKFQLLMGYGGMSPDPEFMKAPNGIAITSKNRIFVADYAENRVNEYLLFDTSDPQAPAPAAPTPPSAKPAAAGPAGAPGAPSAAPQPAPRP